MLERKEVWDFVRKAVPSKPVVSESEAWKPQTECKVQKTFFFAKSLLPGIEDLPSSSSGSVPAIQVPEAPRKTRARKAIDYGEPKLDSEDSKSGKESDFEAELQSEAEETAEADLSSSKSKKKERRGAIETDDEEMDSRDNAERRRQRRTAARMRFGTEAESQVFVLEDGDTQWLRQWYVGRLISGSRKYGKVKGTLPPKTQARLEAGEITGSAGEASAIVRTAKIYYDCLLIFLRELGNYYAAKARYNLDVDGKLRLKQFMVFDHKKFVPVPENALTILKAVPSANVRKLCYAAYASFVTFLFRYLFEEDTLNMFVTEDESAAGMKMASKERMKVRTHIDQVRQKLKTDKAYTGFDAEIENTREQRETFEREIAGRRPAMASVDTAAYLEL